MWVKLRWKCRHKTYYVYIVSEFKKSLWIATNTPCNCIQCHFCGNLIFTNYNTTLSVQHCTFILVLLLTYTLCYNGTTGFHKLRLNFGTCSLDLWSYRCYTSGVPLAMSSFFFPHKNYAETMPSRNKSIPLTERAFTSQLSLAAGPRCSSPKAHTRIVPHTGQGRCDGPALRVHTASAPLTAHSTTCAPRSELRTSDHHKCRPSGH